MPLNTFSPNTVIRSAQINDNFTNFSNHSLNFSMKFSFGGTLTVQTGTDYLMLPDTGTIERVDLQVSTAPTGAAIIVDIEYSNDNGSTWTTIFTGGTNRPQIAISAKTGNTTTIDVPAVIALTRRYRAKVAQIGSTIAGSDLSIQIHGSYVLD